MLYDLIAAFYTKESDARPRYWVPIGIVSPSALSRFEEDPNSTAGYTDYVLRNATDEDLQLLGHPSYDDELLDVRFGTEFERIDIHAYELDALDDEGTVAPRGFMLGETFIKFVGTSPSSPVVFIKGDPFHVTEDTPVFQIPLKELKDYFGLLTTLEVLERFKMCFTDENCWTFERLKKYFYDGGEGRVKKKK